MTPAQATNRADSIADDEVVQNVTITDTGVKFEVVVPWEELLLEEVVENGKPYTRVSLPGWAETGQAGAPQLPMLTEQAAVPVDADVELWVVPGEARRVKLSAPVLPVATARVGIMRPGGGLPQPEYVVEEDAGVYGGGEYPGALAMVMNDGMLRQQRVIGLVVYPVQYDARTNELVVYESLEVEVRYSAGSLYGGGVEESEVYEGVFAEGLLNYESSQEMREPQGMMMRPMGLMEAGGAAGLPWSPPEPGWRVKVREEGLYKLTHFELESADPAFGSPDVSTLQLFNEGLEVAIKVVDVNADGFFNSTSAEDTDFIIFYGQGVESKYTWDNVYWLTYGGGVGLRVASHDGTPTGGGVPEYFYAKRHYEENKFYFSSPPGDDNLERYFFGWVENPEYSPDSGQWQYKFNTPTRVAGLNAELRLRLLGSFNWTTSPDHHAQVKLNGALIGDVRWDGLNFTDLVMSAPLQAGENTLDVTLPGDTGFYYDSAYIDWLEVVYPSAYIAQEDELAFTYPAAGEYQFHLDGFTSPDLAVYDVTDPWNVHQIENFAVTGDSVYDLQFSDVLGGETSYLAQPAGLFKEVSGIEADTPSSLGDASNGADYILITPRAFWEAAGTLTAHRAGQGLRAARVDVQDIYDEFNYGVVSAAAIHDFLKYAYESWDGVAPSFVVLMGDGHYDPKNHEGFGRTSFIPPYLANVDPWIGETAADNRYVTVSGADTMPDMMLGRMAVNTLAEAEAFVNKIIAYEANPPADWQKQVLAVADNTDTGGNFALISDNLLAASLAAPFTAEKVYYKAPSYTTPEAARTGIQSAVNAGKLIVNYIGHAANNQWADEGLLRSSDVSALANGSKQPIMLSMACYDGFFLYPHPEFQSNSLAEVITNADGKGAIASWSATGMGVASGHDQLNRGFLETLLSDESVKLGQAAQAGKLKLWSTHKNQDLLDTFLLFGDPALVVPRVPPLSVSGTITGSGGAPLAGVTVSTNGKTATTDNNGNFVFKGLPAGTYTFTPSKTGYAFTPVNSGPLTLATENITGVNFSASLAPIYGIYGTVTNYLGNPLPGVTVSDDQGHTSTTDALGKYALSGLTIGSYEVSVAKDDYVFTVPNQTIVIEGSSKHGINFTGLPLLAISGAINAYGQPLAGVEVGDGHGHTVQTDEAGEYLFDDITPEEYTLTPQKKGYEFTPSSQTVALILEDVQAVDFEATLGLKITDIPDQLVMRGSPFATINLDDFVSDIDNTDDEMVWSWLGNTDLQVDITERVATITVPNGNWSGSESITFRATDPDGFSVEDGAVFTVIGFTPANEQKLAEKRVSFDWDDIPGANQYTIQLSLVDNFSSMVVNTTSAVSSYSYTKDLLNGKTYYWRIRPGYGTTWGDWLETQRLYAMNPPLAPAQLAPVPGNYFNLGTVDFSWNQVANDHHYQLEISKASSFASNSQEKFEENLDREARAYTATGLPNGTHYWRVRAVDEVGVVGAWSQTRTFTLYNWAAPVPKSPLPGSSINNQKPTLSVNPVAGAKSYRFRVVQGGNCEEGVSLSTSADISSVNWPVNILLPYSDEYRWCAKAIDAAGNETPWLEAPFTVTVQNLPAPAPNNKTALTTPTFTWYAAPGAIGYELEVLPAVEEDNPATQSYSVSLGVVTKHVLPAIKALDAGKYQWRLRVHTNTGDQWTPPRELVVLPGAPLLDSPVNGGYATVNTPQLSWNAVPGAAEYNLQVSKNNKFSGLLTLDEKNLAGTTYSPSTPGLPDGVYYWRVQAVNYLSDAGAWSAVRSFTVDTTPPAPFALKLPVTEATVLGTPTFSWNAAAGAKYYTLQIYAEAEGDDYYSFTSPKLTALSYKPAITVVGAYSWKVTAEDLAGNTTQSEERQVTINPLKPAAPGLVSPANGFVVNDVQNPIELKWHPVSYAGQYELQVSKNNKFTVLEDVGAGALTEERYELPNLSEGVYYWRVQAVNGQGAGAWSAVRSFTVDRTGPNPPSLVAPKNDAIVSGTPVFNWKTSPSAVGYQFAYSLESGDPNEIPPGGLVYQSGEVKATAIKPPAMNPSENEYYWFVRARDAAGNWSDWSLANKVKINLAIPAAVMQTKPLNGAITNDNTPLFEWQAVDYADTYNLQVSKDIKFTAGVSPIDLTEYGNTTYEPVAPELETGVYYWRVQAVNGQGAGAWSAVRSFTVDTTPPAAPSLAQPLNNAFINNVKPTLSVAALKDAKYYQFKIITGDTCETGSESPDSGEIYAKNSWAPQEALGYGEYSWCARVFDAAGNPSGWSGPRGFTVTYQKLPLNGVVTPLTTPTFSWFAVPGARGYWLEIEPVLETGNTATRHYMVYLGTETSHTIPRIKALDPGKYQWRLSTSASGEKATPWATFVISLPAPLLDLPANGGYATVNTPQLSWNAVGGAVKYKIQVDTNAKFDPKSNNRREWETTGADPFSDVPADKTLPDGRYFWRVQAVDYLNNGGGWSQTWTFTVDTRAPQTPKAKAPLPGAFIFNTRPALTVNGISDARFYQFKMFELLEDASIDCSAADALADSGTGFSKTSWTAPMALNFGKYAWCARAIDTAGNESDWTVPMNLTVTNQNQPAFGAVTALTTPTFTWYAVTGATGYELEVQPAGGTGNPATQSYSVSLGSVTKHVMPTVEAINPGVYQWRLRVITAAGAQESPWRELVVRPAAPQLRDPINGYVYYTLNSDGLDLIWFAVPGADRYKIEVANNNRFLTPEIYTPTDSNQKISFPTAGKYYWRVTALNDYLGNLNYLHLNDLWSEVRAITVKSP